MTKILKINHKRLKILGIFVLCFVLLIFNNLAFAAELTHVEVPQNPYNSLAEQLASKQNSLNSREAALNALQDRLDQGYKQVFLVLAILFLLIVSNFVLDYRRRKKQTATLSNVAESAINKTVSHLNI